MALDRGYADACAAVLASHLHHDAQDLEPFDRVVGLKEGTPTLAIALAARLGKRVALFRGASEPKFAEGSGRGALSLFDGPVEPGERVLIADDSTTGGRKVIECVSEIRQLGAEVSDCAVLFEPVGKDARGRLRQAGVTLRTVITLDADALAEI
jgi:orotate phosphoribosyltransferase